MFKKSPISIGVALALGGAAALPALAQQDATQRVEVTGSHIRRVQAETAAPITVISSEQIQNSGRATVGEFLQTLAVDGQGSVPPSFTNGFAPGSIGVSLRGLGAGSTLVLVNGRRMAAYGLADDGQKVFTDLSTIPMEAVERVEILKDGASAIYGSDAIAGVVNIILRKSYNGILAKASYGTSRYGDGDTKIATFLAGTGNLDTDGYSVYLNLEAMKSDAIRYKDRSRDWIGTSDTRPWGYVQGGTFNTPAGAITAGGTAAGSSLVGNVRVGGLYQSLPGCGLVAPTLTPADPGGGCLWDAQKLYGYLLPEVESYSLFGRGTLRVNNNTEAYAEISALRKSSFSASTPSGVSGAWGFPGGAVNASSGAGAVVLAPTHPDNIGGDRLRYAAWDVGPRTSGVDNDAYRLLAGIRGSTMNWDWDAAVLHSETNLVNRRNGFLRYSVVKAALGDPTSGLFPWRIGVNAGLNAPALYAALSPTIESDGKTKLSSADFRASRELAKLTGGALALAVGLEFRHESNKLTPTTFTDIGDIIGLGYSAFDGSRTLSAVYGELNAPLLKELEVNAALRYDKYSGNLNQATPKIGIKWTPIRQLVLRGTYSEGFRVPNAAEAGTGGVAAFTTARDPVRCPGGVAAPGASAADCNQQVAIITQGNPNLKPEKSKSYTLGFVFEPVAQTNLSVDFWQIKRTDEINQGTVDEALAAGKFVRSDNNLPGTPDSGTLLAVLGSYINSTSSTVRGYDVDGSVAFNLGEAGKLITRLGWTHISSWERVDAGTTYQYAGTHGNCDVTNCIGTPKDKFNFTATWDRGGLQFSGTVNYIGSMKNVMWDGDACASSFADGSDAPSGCRIPSFYTVDVSGRWAVTKQLDIFGSIQNLFDRVAPLDPTTYGGVNFNPLHISGAIGRFYNVGLRYKF